MQPTVGICTYGLSGPDLAHLAPLVEAAGFESLWVGEHLVVPSVVGSAHPTRGDTLLSHGPTTGPRALILDPATVLADPAVALAARPLAPPPCASERPSTSSRFGIRSTPLGRSPRCSRSQRAASCSVSVPGGWPRSSTPSMSTSPRGAAGTRRASRSSAPPWPAARSRTRVSSSTSPASRSPRSRCRLPCCSVATRSRRCAGRPPSPTAGSRPARPRSATHSSSSRGCASWSATAGSRSSCGCPDTLVQRSSSTPSTASSGCSSGAPVSSRTVPARDGKPPSHKPVTRWTPARRRSGLVAARHRRRPTRSSSGPTIDRRYAVRWPGCSAWPRRRSGSRSASA